MMARAALAAATIASAMAQDLDTGRDVLFSNPSAELPDVYISESVIFTSETASRMTPEAPQEYTVVLTHPPGMREDETIDLDNDEVRIYLSSSQEHFQQDDPAGTETEGVFRERRNHRTQLLIYTNDVNSDGDQDTTTSTAVYGAANTIAWSQGVAGDLTGALAAGHTDGAVAAGLSEVSAGDISSGTGAPGIATPLGPLPYIYKTFSTVGGNIPEQQSPLSSDGATVEIVCPVCTHPAYCVLYDGTEHSLINNPGTATVGTDAASITAETAADQAKAVGGAADIADLATLEDNVGMVRLIPGSARPDAGGSYTAETAFRGCYQVKITYAPVMDMCADDPGTVVSDLNPLDFTVPCSKDQASFTIYNGLLPRQAGGSHPDAISWSYTSPVPVTHTVPGASDFRIDEIGDQILRTRADPRPLCRYSNCPELTVNGGDQQPESANFLYPDYTCVSTSSSPGNPTDSVACGSSWRGDLSSSAQLVFDSANWNVPQTVQVMARDDDVYEPEVNNRGQDAYVHHFVVAQDINLEHTYYDDIEVNDLTVSIVDDDPAVVIENYNEVNPTEGGPDAEIKLRLASEPMYPVTVYLQSGSFFNAGAVPGEECTGCDDISDNECDSCFFSPDDEQVIFQDKYQYETCWTIDSSVRTYTYPLVRDQPASFRGAADNLDHGGTYNYQGCFESATGEYMLVDAPIDTRVPSSATRQIPATMQCHGDDRCVTRAETLPNGVHPRDNFNEGRAELVQGSTCRAVPCSEILAGSDDVGHYVESGQPTGTASPGTTLLDLDTGATAQRTCKKDGKFLTLRTYSSDGISHLPTTGYTCNSYVTFSTTNWNTWQTLDVIGVSDDADEGEFRVSEIGFLYESIDWYYNSVGSKWITKNFMYAPSEDGAVAGSEVARPEGVQAATSGATVSLSMFDTRFGKHINRYPRLAGEDDLGAAYSSADQKFLNDATVGADVVAAWSAVDDTVTATWEYGSLPNVEQFRQAMGDGGGYYGTPATWGTPCHGNSQCIRTAPFHVVDSMNEVCCCEVEDGSTNQDLFLRGADRVAAFDTLDDTAETYAITTTATAGTVGGAEDDLQVQTFQPSEYENRNVQCGAMAVVTDNNQRGVTISRETCEATEGRRFWFDTFQQEPTPMECGMAGELYSLDASGTKGAPMDITLGLFTRQRGSDNAVDPVATSYLSFADIIADLADAGTGAHLVPKYGTIQGDISDNTVDVVTGRNHATTAAAGSSTAEASALNSDGTTSSSGADVYGDSVDPDATMATNIACPSIGADGWTMVDWPATEYAGMTAPVCPYTIVLDTAPLEGTTVVVHLREDFETSNLRDHELYFYEEASYRAGVTAGECFPALYPGSSWVNNGCFIHNVPLNADDIPIPRGNTDLDVMFTDADWNVPRRITTIALNDDVDEPTEVRTIYHTVGPCTGYNHNNDESCLEDPTYTGIAVSNDVVVIVVDDDIADLVVIADDGYTTDGTTDSIAADIDELFIGSYDAAGPQIDRATNYWYQRFERQGPYAEDGISGSNFQGRSQVHNDARASYWGQAAAGTWAPAVAGSCSAPVGTYTTEADCTQFHGSPSHDDFAAVWTAATTATCTAGGIIVGGTEDACAATHESFPWIDAGTYATAYFYGTGTQIFDDGIGGGGYEYVSGTNTPITSYTAAARGPTGAYVADTAYAAGATLMAPETFLNEVEDESRQSVMGGYVTDPEDPLCVSTDPMVQDDRCFRIDNKPWTSYDPYWDVYTKGGTPYDATSASARNVYDDCTPVGHPNEARSPNHFLNCSAGALDASGDVHTAQPNRGFKGVGPAYTEPDDEFAITIHSRECRGDTFGDAPAFWGTADDSATEGADAIEDILKAGFEPGDSEPAGFGEGGDASTPTTCVYGTFMVRLNSSPGTKHIRRQYVGEPTTVLEEEAVFIVVTPDVTPQTMFDPVSVTFTHTGEDVEGVDSYRWDEPATFKVVPVDDEVDERAGVVIDFTSFTITQSHWGDAYWDYVVPYQVSDGSTGSMKVASATASSSDGRNDGATPFRHHIRTIHTKDNDYAGVTIESGASTTPTQYQSLTANENYNTHEQVDVAVEEGLTFSYYTLRLDTQPRKVQRQAGTHPNDIVHAGAVSPATRPDYALNTPGGRVEIDDATLHTADSSDTDLAVVAGDQASPDPAGIYHVQHHGNTECDWEDFSDVTRCYQCGSVEPEQNYWVDVSVTQTIHVDLAEPKSCPDSAPWGGGATPPAEEHPRFPYNGFNTLSGSKPINELTQTADSLDSYLSTCGGWQRDATYRFDADNWDVPQYVYLYAHNDKDSDRASADGTQHVDEGGNDADSVTTTLKHYVETQDTLDNMVVPAAGARPLVEDSADSEVIEGYVQRNKHGAQYTHGNTERYPFGVVTEHIAGNTTGRTTGHDPTTTTTGTNQPLTGVDGMQEAILTEPFGHRVTGYTTYGYSDYQWIYGYYEQAHTWTGVHIGLTPCAAVHMGAGIGHSVADGASNAGGSNVGAAYDYGYATSDASDVVLNASLPGISSCVDPVVGCGTDPADSWGYVEPFTGEFCLDPFDNRKPYTQGTRSDLDNEDASLGDGAHCIPVRDAHTHSAGDAAALGGRVVDAPFVRLESVRTSPGPNGAAVGPTVDASSWPTTNSAGSGIETKYCVPKYATKNGGMFFKPNDVNVVISDNDIIAEQADIADCKTTSLYSYPDDSSRTSEWLVDHNCLAGDAGGLPGFPASEVAWTPGSADSWRRLATDEGKVLGEAGLAGNSQCEEGMCGAYCDRAC